MDLPSQFEGLEISYSWSINGEETGNSTSEIELGENGVYTVTLEFTYGGQSISTDISHRHLASDQHILTFMNGMNTESMQVIGGDQTIEWPSLNRNGLTLEWVDSNGTVHSEDSQLPDGADTVLYAKYTPEKPEVELKANFNLLGLSVTYSLEVSDDVPGIEYIYNWDVGGDTYDTKEIPVTGETASKDLSATVTACYTNIIAGDEVVTQSVSDPVGTYKVETDAPEGSTVFIDYGSMAGSSDEHYLTVDASTVYLVEGDGYAMDFEMPGYEGIETTINVHGDTKVSFEVKMVAPSVSAERESFVYEGESATLSAYIGDTPHDVSEMYWKGPDGGIFGQNSKRVSVDTPGTYVFHIKFSDGTYEAVAEPRCGAVFLEWSLKGEVMDLKADFEPFDPLGSLTERIEGYDYGISVEGDAITYDETSRTIGYVGVGEATITITHGNLEPLTIAVRVMPGNQPAPAAGEGYDIDYHAETVTAWEGYELSADAGATVAQKVLDAEPGAELYVRLCSTESAAPSPWTSNNLPARPVIPADPVFAVTETSISVGDGLEICLPGEPWVSKIEGLEASTFYVVWVRSAATDATFAGQYVTSKVETESPETVSVQFSLYPSDAVAIVIGPDGSEWSARNGDTLELPPGVYTVAVSASGYVGYTGTVTVTEGFQTYSAQLSPEQPDEPVDPPHQDEDPYVPPVPPTILYPDTVNVNLNDNGGMDTTGVLACAAAACAAVIFAMFAIFERRRN